MTSKPIPPPPGGLLTCSTHQVPIVEVVDGEIYASCNDIPAGIRPNDYTQPPPQFRNYVMGLVRKEERDPYQKFTDEEERIWEERRFEGLNPNLGKMTVVTFAIPGDGKDPAGSEGPDDTGSGWDSVPEGEHYKELIPG